MKHLQNGGLVLFNWTDELGSFGCADTSQRCRARAHKEA